MSDNRYNTGTDTLVLISSDGERFEVPQKVASLSELIASMVNKDDGSEYNYDCGNVTDNDNNCIRNANSDPNESEEARCCQPSSSKTLISEDLLVSPIEIPLPRVRSAVLSKIIEFCSHYMEDPMPIIEPPFSSERLEDLTSRWYFDYIEALEWDLLRNLLTASDYLSINPLLQLTTLAVSIQMMGKSPEEIRIMLGFPTMSAEQIEQSRQEERWLYPMNDIVDEDDLNSRSNVTTH